MKVFVLGSVLCFGLLQTQTTTTNTNCNTNGNTANCTSTSQTQSDNSAAQARQNYQNGYQMGTALGNGFAAMIQRRRIKKYCQKNPGQSFVYRNGDGQVIASGDCPTH